MGGIAMFVGHLRETSMPASNKALWRKHADGASSVPLAKTDHRMDGSPRRANGAATE